MTVIGLLHAALVSVVPVNQAIARLYPDWEPVNLLDDGLQQHFHSGDAFAVQERLSDLARIACEAYGAKALLVTCSAAKLETVEGLYGVPCVKIDFPMCEAAVRTGGRIGVVVSFRPTLGVTIASLTEASRRAGAPLSYSVREVRDAFALLNDGDRASHDQLITAAAEELVLEGVSCVVLAQVSMAHLAEPLSEKFGIPVLESLSTSLEAVGRRLLKANAPSLDG